MKIAVEIPEEDRERLLSAIKSGDPELLRYLTPPKPSIVRDLYEGKCDWPKQRNSNEAIENICCCLHLVARKLSSRHGGRQSIIVGDEYDVQDLFGALLVLEFTDVRKEEWTPSYGGGSARVDFLLKPERTVVEVKKTRPGLGAKELGDQLLVDIGRYRAHPDCQSLICFAYDPDGIIANPCGIENDLNGVHNDLAVKVIIAPKGV
jgi:DpnII restriction endonuclease